MSIRTLSGILAAATLSGCAMLESGGSGEPAGPWSQVTRAQCLLSPTAGNSASGTVTLSETDKGVKVVAYVSGLTPNGRHGIHIHQWGDVSGRSGKATGGHYNPDDHPHAGPADTKRHAGDLGNLQADGAGMARYEAVFGNISLAGEHNPVIGRGMIVHAGSDDLKSQPTGAAGARLAQCVIGVAKP